MSVRANSVSSISVAVLILTRATRGELAAAYGEDRTVNLKERRFETAVFLGRRLKIAAPWFRWLYAICRQALTVFAINIAIVIGPTPPGTGVMADALADTSSNATSPTNR